MVSPLHGGLIAAYHQGTWRGVLLLGPSGSGKSDLALRSLEHGWRLVADDRVIAWSAEGRAFGRAPMRLAGLIELRGQGFAVAPTLRWAEITHVAHLAPPADRQPEPTVFEVAGAPLPSFAVAPYEASAPMRLRRIVEGLDHSL